MTRTASLLPVAAFCLLALSTSAPIAAAGQERVRFAAGTSSATLHGSVRGDQTIDYVLGARAGQTMSVKLQASSGAAYFNVLPPGSDAAIAIGTIVGTSWSGTLPADGDYRVRVYLVRSAARRGEAATYTLTVSVTGPADALVHGTRFHATGTVGCSVGTDAPGSSQCSFGVIRAGAGRAEVHLASPGFDVTLHKSDVRILEFAGNTVTSANTNEKVVADKKGDDWLVVVNGFFHYRIPEAVISGG